MSGSKVQRIIGWVLCGLTTIFLIGPSAMGKFTEWEGKNEMFAKFGFSNELMFQIGILEVVLALLLVLPRTGFIGAILLTGYLGGAAAVHIRVNDAFIMPIIMGVVMWVGLALRQPAIWSLAVGNDPRTKY